MNTLDKNGYAPSLMTDDMDECYLCRYEGDLVRHEPIHGTAGRKNSKKYGLWIPVCVRCHEQAHNDSILDAFLKKKAQLAFYEKYSRDLFMDVFGKSYL